MWWRSFTNNLSILLILSIAFPLKIPSSCLNAAWTDRQTPPANHVLYPDVVQDALQSNPCPPGDMGQMLGPQRS